MKRSFFVTVPHGMESLLAGELRGLGAQHVRQARAGVSFEGPLETAYRVCLWSRLAGRVLLPLVSGPAADGEQLYATARRVQWDTHLGVEETLVVDFTGTSESIRDTRYGAVRIKDAVVDQFREGHGGRRPSVDPHRPDVRINGHLARGGVTIALDLSGDSLHRRGYRTDKVQVDAPLKENLAAAMLLFAAWPQEAAAGGGLLDPLCGSATLPIEAAMMAADVAPGLLRAGLEEVGPARTGTGSGSGGRGVAPAFGFLRWRGHDAAAWRGLVDEARERRRAGLSRVSAAAPGRRVRGSDHDPRALEVARACVERAGLSGAVGIDRADVRDIRPFVEHGLVAANLPYGERLGHRDQAEALTKELGEALRGRFAGWRAVLLTGGSDQARASGLDVKRRTSLRNGPLECELVFCEVAAGETGPRLGQPAAPRSARAAARSSAAAPAGPGATATASALSQPAAPTRAPGLLGGGAEQLANRLHKNLRRMSRQLRREGITCYRAYDADLPEYSLVVDVYGEWVHVQEYAPPAEIDPAKAARRLEDALAVIGAVLQAPPERVVLKQRRRQRGAAQYERRARTGAFIPVTEDDLTYLVNLTDYLDTGLFVDQRLSRRLVRKLAGGRRFLNLFAYTGTMTVDALAGGSPASTTVDLSSTYLEWARRNLEANGFAAAAPSPHRLVQADCLRWLAEDDGEYDLVWLDPPTFSNSKRMGRATFDVQRDHPDLLRLAARRVLAPGGILLFATNRRGFRLDRAALIGLTVTDLSRDTLPFDCARAANRHHVFRLEHAAPW